MKERIDKGRRRFLIATGWSAVGLTVMFSSGCSLPVLPTTSDDPDDDVDSWLQLLDDGRFRLYIGKSDMGQGVMTGIAQLAAEELRVGLHRLQVLAPTTNDIPPVRMTVGSESINSLYLPVRRAAARLRAAVVTSTARALSYRGDDIELGDEALVIASSGRRLEYRELLATPRLLSGGGKFSLKPEAEFREIGQPRPRLDLLDKLTGTARYSHDIRLQGMLHGQVLAPPAFGARLLAADTSRASHADGVHTVHVEIDTGFVGVVADSRQNAARALAMVSAEWAEPETGDATPLDIDHHAAASSGRSIRHIDDGAESPPAETIDRRYTTPFAAHAPMETNAALANVGDEGAEVWASTQDAFYHRALVARLTGLDKEAVTIHNTVIGGGFGGKVRVDAVIDAVRLSAAARRPVKVIWSREDSFRRGYFRSPSSHRIRAALGDDGRIRSWRHELASGPIIYSPSFLNDVMQWATSFMTDQGATRGSEHPYAIPQQSIRYWNVELPVDTGAWRGLGSFANAFAVESAMDELAEQACADPIEFRLRHLSEGQTRLKRVLHRVAEMAGRGDGVHHGVACGAYKDETFVAVIAEVRARPGTWPRLERLYCAHDCGRVVNPDLVRAQVEGNLVWGVGSALSEALSLVDGHFDASNFHNYRLVRMRDCPDIRVELVEDPRHHPSGAGEAALMPTPAAIANAFSRALGERQTALPIRP